jgi:large-conductance mechanosensitive channel
MQADDEILDFPERQDKRSPKSYYVLLLLGIISLAVGLVIDWFFPHIISSNFFKVISAFLIFLHFAFRIFVNWGIDYTQTIRDFGQMLALAGIYGRFLLMTWAIYVMLIGLTVYMFGFALKRRRTSKET